MAIILEHALPQLIEDFDFCVEEIGALGNAEAVTDISRPVISFDLRAYNSLRLDRPRARMTAAHELGHLLMHTGQTGHAFKARPDRRADPEVQADIFAEAFLMPECAFRKVASIGEAMARFGVSKDAACYRARVLKMTWLIAGRAAPGSRRHGKKIKGRGRTRAP
jgi:Zn-dependent peptidase ImmA (M78 family)